LHHRLGLTAEQEKRIAVLESNYATIRKSSEAEMRAANAALAQAFHEDHAYTPKVQAAIDRFHHAMAELQKQTMIHIAAMRSVLTPAQAAQFDETIVKALTEDPS
jgi:Spy/CpxP family protein refolding chaperone